MGSFRRDFLKPTFRRCFFPAGVAWLFACSNNARVDQGASAVDNLEPVDAAVRSFADFAPGAVSTITRNLTARTDWYCVLTVRS